MRLGFRYTEALSGAYHLLEAPMDERAIRYRVTVRVPSVKSFLRDRSATCEGDIHVEGLADRKSLRGSAALKLVEEGRLLYDLGFDGDDGKAYVLRGEKDLQLATGFEGVTTMPASLYDASGKEIGRAVLRFDLRSELRPFLRSLRLLLS